MATIKYNGMELEEFKPSEAQFFNPPLKGVFYCGDTSFEEGELYSYDPRFCSPYRDGSNSSWPNFALLPEKPAPRRATWYEVAKWCATGNGLVWDTYRDRYDTGIMWKPEDSNKPIEDAIKVRKWEDTEWHEPTVDYLGIGEERE